MFHDGLKHQFNALLLMVSAPITPFGSLLNGGLLLLVLRRYKMPSARMALQIGKEHCSCSKAQDVV